MRSAVEADRTRLFRLLIRERRIVTSQMLCATGMKRKEQRTKYSVHDHGEEIKDDFQKRATTDIFCLNRGVASSESS
jgi:hypothetical protein